MHFPFQVITPTTDQELESYFDLRWRILRSPWKQPRGSERDQFEDTAQHVMACRHGGQPAGVGRLHFNNAQQAQIRYVAVEVQYRGAGVGRAMMQALEELACASNAGEVILNSRENAVPFYERLNYQKYADGDVLYGEIKHVKMRKSIVT